MLLSVLLLATLQVVGSEAINALAVSPGGSGFVVPINVTVVAPGDGSVYVAAVPSAGGGFGPSAQVAYYVATRLLGANYSNYTVLVRVLGDLPVVGGPSASAYIAVAIYSIISRAELRSDAAMTGIILPDGLVGPVGGVRAKAEAAGRRGIRVVVVPVGQGVSVSGVDVVEVGTIEQAVTVLTNASLRLDYGEPSRDEFSMVGRFLYRQVAEIYRRETGLDIPDEALAEARAGHYYTAASLIYQALIRYYSSLVETGEVDPGELEREARRLADEAAESLREIRVTARNVDMVVAIYRRIIDVEDFLERGDVAAAYVRAMTLGPWLEAAERFSEGRPVDLSSLRGLARLYLEFAKAMYAYIGEILESEVPGVKQMLDRAIGEYREGRHLTSLAESIEVISRSAAVLWGEAVSRDPDPVLGLVRERALNMTARAQRCGLTGVLPLSYVEFGDYYSELGDPAMALSLYLSASIYATSMGDLLCGGINPLPELEAPDTAPVEAPMTPAMVLVPLILLITLFAVALASR